MICEKLLDEKLKEETLNAKLYLQNTGQLSNLENAINQNINISANFDGSWNSGGWSFRTGIVDACFEPTGKVLDVILKSTHCTNCEETKNEYEAHQMTTVEYLTWCTEHETKCLMNHEGPASVLSLQILKPKFNFISSVREFNFSENLCLF